MFAGTGGDYDPNQVSLDGFGVTSTNQRKPFFQRFGWSQNLRYFASDASKDYKALQVKIEKRFSLGLSFLASYTRSKLIDDASSVFDSSIFTGPVADYPVADGFNRRLDRDVSNGDIPNATAVSWTYELPVGRGHKVNPSDVLGKFTNGWQIAGIVSIQSGIPLAVKGRLA